MIESELKLAQMTRNLENHNRTTAYEWSGINFYLNGYERVPHTLHTASELVHIQLVFGQLLKEYDYKDYLSYRRKSLERLIFCNKFHENRWIGFVDMVMCIFLNV